MKGFRILIIAMLLLSFSSQSVFAANQIKVGASVESAYQSQGNCAHGDRVTNVYVDNFINEITYDPLFGDPVATKLFKWQDNDAWEEDLLHSGMYGISYDNVDDVDFMVFSGHGYSQGLHGVPYNSCHYYTLNSSSNFHPSGDEGERDGQANADSYEIWWGYDSDGVNPITKWVTTYSCNFLNTSGSYWSSIMQGVHLVMGFGSVMYIIGDEGKMYGKKLREGAEIKTAFFDSAMQYQPQNSTPTVVRVLGAAISEHDKITQYSTKPSAIEGSDTYYYWTITVQPN
ncbi:DUF6345 domain-containing protein [Clostridium sp. DJ247]|uniref:DUF6345 domain-containing protein n=1 Tax=Clostridium sp. DJ247 TaxID=2726188 RepID=UPI00162A4D4A|nr:DUF6345 domain-containing protein [Clostridium sp. DJ247]MBC2581523.1 hypothetical protein [Clostridium sp. DJ247]